MALAGSRQGSPGSATPKTPLIDFWVRREGFGSTPNRYVVCCLVVLYQLFDNQDLSCPNSPLLVVQSIHTIAEGIMQATTHCAGIDTHKTANSNMHLSGYQVLLLFIFLSVLCFELRDQRPLQPPPSAISASLPSAGLPDPSGLCCCSPLFSDCAGLSPSSPASSHPAGSISRELQAANRQYSTTERSHCRPIKPKADRITHIFNSASTGTPLASSASIMARRSDISFRM